MTIKVLPGPKGPGLLIRVSEWIGPLPFRQSALLFGLLIAFWFFGTNTLESMNRAGLTPGFGFLSQQANFEIGESVIAYRAGDSYGRALLAGLANTAKVALFGCILATILGVTLGIARLAGNRLIAALIRGYVEILRGTPLLLQLFVWTGIFQSLPAPRNAVTVLDLAFLSNRGVFVPSVSIAGFSVFVWLPVLCLFAGGVALAARRIFKETNLYISKSLGLVAVSIGLPLAILAYIGHPPLIEVPARGGFNIRGGWSLTPEFAALLTGLTINASAMISEIVRSGIQSVQMGQWEAARALGLKPGQIMRLVVLPQALRVITPLMTSSYLDLTKNSSLAVAIGFPDIVSVANTTANTTGQVIESIAIIMVVYLTVNLFVSALMNQYNRKIALKGAYPR
ncbi:amino acid ABC transporter permease [Rhizobium sp. KAs_5_22]|uniref:amino acid ABC transporter permease n=1 Tax=Ciceribacter selenitireducens TaxID=448181 RepID=UPI0004B1B24B|nr:ABC transporter permease subunit [Ciceribacter selenitireducens]PPJ48230.1 amino acid ABC transporter permease [Rhizobium sp. KAs_5_22]